MKNCPKCHRMHDDSHPHFVTLSRLTDKGYPTHSSGYSKAHQKANQEEEKKFGKKNFKKLEKIDRSVGKHELVGKNLKNGKIEVSRKVPKDLRKEVAYHEKVENKVLRKKK